MKKKIQKYRFKYKKLNIEKTKNTTATGFEPMRVTPSDFESDALTTRPNCLILKLKIFPS